MAVQAEAPNLDARGEFSVLIPYSTLQFGSNNPWTWDITTTTVSHQAFLEQGQQLTYRMYMPKLDPCCVICSGLLQADEQFR